MRNKDWAARYPRRQREELLIRTLTIGLLAAAGLALAIPANAQDVSARVRAAVDVGLREHNRERVMVSVGQRARHCKMLI